MIGLPATDPGAVGGIVVVWITFGSLEVEDIGLA
jgi:hypothetical protein